MTQTIEPAFLRTLELDPLSAGADKNERGEVLVVAGGRGVPGAPWLVGLAALRAGAGKLAIAATAETGVALGLAAPEAAIIRTPTDAQGEISLRASACLAESAEGADAVVVGPGMMNSATARALTMRLMTSVGAPFVVDAGALPSLAATGAFASAGAGRSVLTPHAGEMAAMLDLSKEEILARPLEAAREAAGLFHSIVVMKGPTTWVVSPDGLAWRHDGGVPGLGTSGSGDVLAGAIAGFLAQGHPPMNAAAWGVYVHASAGAALAETVGSLGFLARELLDVIPRARAAVSQRDEGPATTLPTSARAG